MVQLRFGNVELEGERRPVAVTNRAANELLEYLAGKRSLFDIPLRMRGTDFERAVWSYASTIPYGQTRTPSEVAQAIGRPGSQRAVGVAAAKNPLPVFVPTHRVVGKSGTRRSGAANARAEKFLLKLEQTSGR